MAARAYAEMRRRAEMEEEVGPSGQGVETSTPDGSSSGATAPREEGARMSLEQGRPIGPDQPIDTPVVEPDYISQAMNVPLFERLLKQTTDVQAQLSYRARRIEELLMSIPTRADIMDHESRKAAAREEVERQGRHPVGTEKIPQNEGNFSPYGHQEDITAERGPKGRQTEEGKYDFEYSTYGHQEDITAERGRKGRQTEEGKYDFEYSPYGHQEYITAERGPKGRQTEEGKYDF